MHRTAEATAVKIANAEAHGLVAPLVTMASGKKFGKTDEGAIYLDRPGEMSEEFQQAVDRPRAVADYIAGMTDRFALKEHQRLTGQALFGNSWSSLGRAPA